MKNISETLKAKFFVWLMNISFLSRLYRAMMPTDIRTFIRRNMIGSISETKKLSLLILEYMRDLKIIVNNSEKIVEHLSKNILGIFSTKFLDIFYNKNINAYIFNDVVWPKFKNIDYSETIFADTLLFYTLLNDNYSKAIVSKIEPLMPEGPYMYIDNDFRVLVEQDDIVIDAGAFIGDFSAYAAVKIGGGGACYAFEPSNEIYEMLCKTNEMNVNKFIPVKYALSDKVCDTPIAIYDGGSSLFFDINKNLKTETIKLTTIDEFVKENNIPRVDFIKADIEGAERDMLKGAFNVLRKFAPKLAICTYHLPDDPQVLENLILEANPKYKVVQLKSKLFACVP